MSPQNEESHRLLRLARRDYSAFLALVAAPGVEFAVAAFHAQQAVEKALKAVMSGYGLEYRRTHDLEELASRIADTGVVSVPVSHADLRALTPYGVAFRYDDEITDILSPSNAKQFVDEILSWAQNIIGAAT